MEEIRSYSFISWAHIASAVIAMVLGAWVLLRRKGDRRHRSLGYGYVSAMGVVNLSAFGLYGLFGTFGPFHVAAIISLLTMLAGLRPAIQRPRPADWMVRHMTYMYWSVIGLYAAFFSEVMVRLPLGATFGMAVGSATVLTILLGALFQRRLVKRWSALQAD